MTSNVRTGKLIVKFIYLCNEAITKNVTSRRNCICGEDLVRLANFVTVPLLKWLKDYVMRWGVASMERDKLKRMH